jgi:hypothetical protein
LKPKNTVVIMTSTKISVMNPANVQEMDGLFVSPRRYGPLTDSNGGHYAVKLDEAAA